MSYFKPYIDDTGFHMPTYEDVLEELVRAARRIFGNGIYLGTDSQDYQFIATVAEKIYDTFQILEAVYMDRSPTSAAGAGLDAIVAVNGIARKKATKSTVPVTLTGTPGTRILSGVVADESGRLWDLPALVEIENDGAAEALAVCREAGLVYAAARTVKSIMTPTRGWLGVTNETPASVGSVAESDPALRTRRALSVAQPSRGIMDGLRASIAAVKDVTRSAVFENDTGSVDMRGLPPHSVCAVVEGGDERQIAEALYLKKAPGCYTHGTVAVELTDPAGRGSTVRFMRPDVVDVDIAMTIRKKAGYTSGTPEAIKGVVAGYLNGFEIGGDLIVSILWMVAQQVNADIRAPGFSIESLVAGRHGQGLSMADLALAYNEVARANVNNIAITVL